MSVIGIRVAGGHVRYAVLELDAVGAVQWLNAADEHKWKVPKAASEKPAKLQEVYREFTRLLNKYKPDFAVLKVGETVRGGPSPERIAIEAVIVLACADQHVAVEEKKYQQLRSGPKAALSSKNVLQEAENHVTALSANWDGEIADAIVAALRKLGK